MTQLYVDLDGVLADFDTHHEKVFGLRPDKKTDNIVDWTHVNEHPSFFADIPPMPDMPELWSYVSRFNPIILTGVPASVEKARNNKTAWVRNYLGIHVEVRCCYSREKYLHAQPGDVLVDDWEKYQHLWLKAGGRWVAHTSAANSIAELRKLGVQ